MVAPKSEIIKLNYIGCGNIKNNCVIIIGGKMSVQSLNDMLVYKTLAHLQLQITSLIVPFFLFKLMIYHQILIHDHFLP